MEGKQFNTKAILEQQIDLLNAQVMEHKEREEKVRKVNETVMTALENFDVNGGKVGLMVSLLEVLFIIFLA